MERAPNAAAVSEGMTGMAEHEPGSMDVTGHERMFAGFIRFTTWAVVVIFAVLVFLALANS
jgi:hypothetical protein